MKVKQTVTDTSNGSRIKISLDGKQAFRVHDGEPEDNNTGRNFEDCFSVLDIIKQAHAAGAAGEPLEIEEADTDD